MPEIKCSEIENHCFHVSENSGERKERRIEGTIGESFGEQNLHARKKGL